MVNFPILWTEQKHTNKKKKTTLDEEHLSVIQIHILIYKDFG